MAITAGDPITPALNRTGTVLFKPFKLKKWLVLAVGLAFILLGHGMPLSAQLGAQHGHRFLPSWTLDQWLEWIPANMALILWWCFGGIGITFPIYLWVRWVGSRGYFIFFDNLVQNEARVKAPWQEFRDLGNSLMKLHIAWDLILFNVYLVIVVIAGCLLWPDFKQLLITGRYEATGWTVAAAIFGVITLPIAFIVLAFVNMLIFRLAVPVMYIRRMEARPALRVAWRELFLPNKGPCIRYFLCALVIGMITGIVTEIGLIVLMIVTLCIAFVVMLLPVVGNYPMALASLPAIVFDSLYQLYFVEQFGPQYRIAWREEIRGGFPVITGESGEGAASPVA